MRSIRVALAGVLLVLAACSGDDSSSPEPEPESQESVEESASPEVVPVDPGVVSNLATFQEEADETITVEGFGDFLEVANGFLWVGNPGTETVDRIDLETNKIVGSTPGPLPARRWIRDTGRSGPRAVATTPSTGSTRRPRR